MSRKRFLITILIAAALVSAGCSTAGGDKSGGSGAPQVLALANNDFDGLQGVPAVARFIERVGQISGGRLNVKVESNWQGGGNEARVIHDVAAGKADLGWSGTRAFDVVGDKAFQPLHAPFLVNSYAAEAAVVRDPLARELLGSLQSLGLTGLALTADDLRFPAGASKPLLSPGDFKGLRFGTFGSDVQSQGIKALGAEPTTLSHPRPPETDGLGGLETMWSTYQSNAQYGFMPFITGNAALWPRTVAIFANSKRLRELGATARGWIESAATDASVWSTAHAGDTAAGIMQRVCGFGARIATATPAQLAALRRAAEPAYASMRNDPTLAPTLVRIETLLRSTPPPTPVAVPASCAYQPGDEQRTTSTPPVLTGPGRPGALRPGIYRLAFTVEELLANGLTERDARNNAGVWTWTLGAGRWSYDWKAAVSDLSGPGVYTVCQGWYDLQNDAASFTTTTKEADGGDCGPPTWSARWSATDKLLTWRAVNIPDFAYLFSGKPWQRIG
jgi:TRAP-type transport system periplasmic protein